MKILTAILCFGLIAATGHAADRDFSETQIVTAPVAGTVYMLTGEGGNIAVSVGGDGILMVDDQFASLHGKIQAAIDALSGSDVRFLLNTHWHGDHTGGNEALTGEGAVIIAHDNVRKRLKAGQYVPFFDRTIDPRSKGALPVVTFESSMTVYFNDERVDVLHLPSGHTDGDSIVFFRGSNVVHMGDHFFNGLYPYVDLSSGGDVEGYIKNIETVLGGLQDGVKIIPGHGPLADKEDLKVFLAMLKEATGIVKQAVADGQTLQQVLAKGLPENITGKWGGGFLSTDKWLEILYTSYAK